MILVGLTGGIGSGKSTVSALLAERGAVILDADAVARELQRAGQPVLAAMVERFGDEMLTEDGELDRARLAALVFADPAALADLNALVHPAVGVEMVRRIEAARGTDAVVVLDSPLLAEHPRDGLAATIVVDVPVETAVERLVQPAGHDRGRRPGPHRPAGQPGGAPGHGRPRDRQLRRPRRARGAGRRALGLAPHPAAPLTVSARPPRLQPTGER